MMLDFEVDFEMVAVGIGEIDGIGVGGFGGIGLGYFGNLAFDCDYNPGVVLVEM